MKDRSRILARLSIGADAVEYLKMEGRIRTNHLGLERSNGTTDEGDFVRGDPEHLLNLLNLSIFRHPKNVILAFSVVA